MSDPRDLSDLPPLREVIEAHGLRAKKSLGQNFLFDPGITDRIAQAAGNVTGQTLIEVGPGPGGLTRSLLRTDAAQVIAIEFDPRAIGVMRDLQAVAGADRLQIMADDALKMDWLALLQAHPGAMIVANLPYNISTVLLAGWLEIIAKHPNLIGRMVLMFQKEVADRLMAKPHTKDFSRLSILTQWLCCVDEVMILPPGAFVPPPKVHSSVLRFMPRPHTAEAPSWSSLDRLLQQAFAQRRKMLRSNLKPYVAQLEALGISPTLRAEDVPLERYLALARALDDSKGKVP